MSQMGGEGVLDKRRTWTLVALQTIPHDKKATDEDQKSVTVYLMGSLRIKNRYLIALRMLLATEIRKSDSD